MKRYVIAFSAVATVLALATCPLIEAAKEDPGFKATIVRDGFGVPHIIADSVADAAFGDGYAQAQDRLKLLMDNITTATGTRAAQLGASEIERDYRARITGARHTAYACWDDVPEDVKRVLEGFAAGVNKYLEDHTGPLPPIARPVEPQEILATFQFSGLYRQLNQVQKDLRGMGMDPIAGEGSNGVVLAPSRTVSGNPLILSDPHTPWDSLNRWYEKHYITPEVSACGFMSTGLPLFLFCTTDRIGWTLTRNPGDRGDCFALRLNPDNPRQYFFDGSHRNFEMTEERIEVKGQDAVLRPVALTVHGPVFKKDKGRVYAAGMSLYREVGVPEQLYRALVADNLAEFKKACALCQADGGNIFYTDIEGSTFYCWWNRLNIRNDKYDWKRGVDGSSQDTLYQGILPFEKMPHSTNDPGGYYQASNAADWMLKGGAWGISPEDFPSWLLTSPDRKVLPARSQRVVDLINSKPKHSLEDMLEWSLDTYILGAEWFLPVVERAYAEHGNNGNPNVDEAMKILSAWKKDPRATKGSRGYSVYRELLASFPRGRGLNPADALNVLPMLPDHPEQVPDRIVELTHKALIAAVESLVKLYGTPTPKWGDINVIQLADGRRFPSGAADSVSQGVWQTSQAPKRKPDGKWYAIGGSDALMMTEMSNPPRVFTMVPYGQSDDPASPHFADQTERYTNKQYKRAWFTREDVLKNAESTQEVSSKGSG